MKFSEDWQLAQWRAVKAVANNDLSRIIGFVPLAGYLILFNDEIANLTSFDTFAGIKETSISPFFLEGLLRLKHQVQHPAPVGHRMLRWTNGTSTSTARNVA